jgi:murein DD-endopeptidase MepM/ murein hydrolase activator NlpD
MAALTACGCESSDASDGAADTDSDNDTDADTDSDADTDADTDSDSDTDTDSDTDSDSDTGSETDTGPECPSYESDEEEYAPIQTAGSGIPAGCAGLTWERPADQTYYVAFSGTPGSPASHEGVDYVHDNASVVNVSVSAAAEGEVVYVRTGCPQSAEFSHNYSLRECGAGWGNHVVIHHGGGIYTRYAHLKPATTLVQAGDWTDAGGQLALMGNSGRSELRHLHFELGTMTAQFDPCEAAQSMDYVYDSQDLAWTGK